jgi:hypothetical protein
VAKTLGLGVVGAIEWDPARAAVFSEGADKPRKRFGGAKAAERSFQQSPYLSSLHSAGESIRNAAERAGREQMFRGLIAARTQEAPR